MFFNIFSSFLAAVAGATDCGKWGVNSCDAISNVDIISFRHKLKGES
jgi:hypothetical protein